MSALQCRFVERTDEGLALLSQALDDFYFDRFGDAYLDYRPHNSLNELAGAAMLYDAETPCGCCGWKPLDETTAELKRVYVRPAYRKQGAARQLVEAIETQVRQLGYTRTVLETARETPEAVAFYERIGYRTLPEGFGPYVGDSNCVCLEKTLCAAE